MINVNTLQLAQWAKGKCTDEIIVHGVKVDTRMVRKGDLFVCLKGERVDGHDFAQRAIEAGASCLVVDRFLDLDIPQIIVKDTLEALKMMAIEYKDSLNVFIIGITGSNGKTSTKDMLHAILKNSIATYKNQNTEIGTYLNIFRMNEATEYGIFELGLDLVGDVEQLSEILRPDAALVMSLAPAHMMNFNDVSHIAQEKFTIFNHVQNNDLCFYQGDFKEYRNIAKGQHSFGFNEGNEYVVSDVTMSNDGISFKVNGSVYKTNLLGTHQASNAAGVIALLKSLNMSDALINEGLGHVGLTELRTEIVNHDQAVILLDAYKANPSSTKYAFEILMSYDHQGDKIAFLSDMVELGDISYHAHLEVLNEASKLGLKHVYTLGTEFVNAFSDSDLKDSEYTNTKDFEEFKTMFDDACRSDQMILVKGSRSYALERLLEKEV